MGDRRNRQSGSLHAAIIAVLFVSLMATLGVVFYQNFIAKKEVVVQTEAPKEVEPQVKRVAFNSDIYSLEYPDSWKSEAGENASSATITSPDGKVAVSFVVTDGGIGGACDASDGLKISHYKVDTTPINGLTAVPVYLVESITDSSGGGYLYAIGLSPDSGATHAAIGESHCNLGYVGVASSLVLQDGKVVTPNIMANILFPKLPTKAKDNIAIKDMKQIKDMINTQDYKTAVKILKSARKES